MSGPLAGVKVVELAGLGALPFGTLKLADMGADVIRIDRLTEVPEEKESKGYEYENADASFKVLLSQHFHGMEDDFRLVSYRTISEVVRDKNENISEAVVKIRVADEEDIKISVAESTGPVGALDHAMRIAFGSHFQELRSVQLIDYKVRILQTGLGTDSVVQVLMLSGDGDQTWWTCGADPNIIEASWQALRDSFRFKLMMTEG
jgi:2-isopropylmalate synthase